MVIWQKRDDFHQEKEGDFRAWAFRITYFKALAHRRDRARQGWLVFSDEVEELLQDESLMEEYIRLMAMESMLSVSFHNEGEERLKHLLRPRHPEHARSHQHGRWAWEVHRNPSKQTREQKPIQPTGSPATILTPSADPMGVNNRSPARLTKSGSMTASFPRARSRILPKRYTTRKSRHPRNSTSRATTR